MSILKPKNVTECRIRPAELMEADFAHKGVVYKGSAGKPQTAFNQNPLNTAVDEGIAELFDDVFDEKKIAAAVKAGLKKHSSSLDPETYAAAMHAVDGITKKALDVGKLRSNLAQAMGDLSRSVWQELQKHADSAKTESKQYRLRRP